MCGAVSQPARLSISAVTVTSTETTYPSSCGRTSLLRPDQFLSEHTPSDPPHNSLGDTLRLLVSSNTSLSRTSERIQSLSFKEPFS